MENAAPTTEARRQVTDHTSDLHRLFPKAPLGKLAVTDVRLGVMLLEVIALPLILLLCGYLAEPDDPLWLHSEYHWPWLAPIVVALRYGALAGLGSSAVLLAGWFFFYPQNQANFPQVYFLGGFITVLLVGEFSSIWRNKTRRAELSHHYADQRLEHLVRQYYLLRLSHDRLEQELIGRPMSMRDALHSLNKESNTQEAPARLLQLLGQYCQITSASLHAVDADKANPDVLAQIGPVSSVNMDDPLIAQSLQTRKLCHISQNSTQQSQYLVAAPLLDLQGTPYALLVVQEMPFYALQEENLQVIHLFLNYYTDGQSAKALAAPLLQAYPDCPEAFAVELQRLHHMHERAKVRSAVVLLSFSDAAIEQQVPEQLLRMKRMLDEYWLAESATGKKVLAILMPLGTPATAEGFFQRIEQWLGNKQGQTLLTHGITPQVFRLGQPAPMELLAKIHGMLHV